MTLDFLALWQPLVPKVHPTQLAMYYFWKFELIIDSMSSVCPELLAHLSGFGYGLGCPATQVTSPLPPWLPPSLDSSSSFLSPHFQHVSRIPVVGHGTVVGTGDGDGDGDGGLGSDFWMLRSFVVASRHPEMPPGRDVVGGGWWWISPPAQLQG